jgi:hypothetical protein
MIHLLADARRELLQKTRRQIEEDRAYRWAAFAIESYGLYRETGMHWRLKDSDHFFEEALEHGALADESGAVLRAVCEWMRRYIPRQP